MSSFLTIDDLRYQYGTGRSYHPFENYGRKRASEYRHGVMCPLGDIERDEWRKLVFACIERNNDLDLFDDLVAWYTKHNCVPGAAEEIELKALINYSTRLYEDELWVDFVNFSRAFRPYALHVAKLATVNWDCCNVTDVITKATMDHHSGEAPCPKCGRFSTYKIIK